MVQKRMRSPTRRPVPPCLAAVFLLITGPLCAQTPSNPQQIDEIRAALFEATNNWRTGEGVNTLTRDSRIDEIIQLHVEDKAACGYTYEGAPGGSGHNSCDGTNLGGRVSTYFSGRSENAPTRFSENMLRTTATGTSVAQTAVNSWAGSTGHRANMIDTAVGVIGIGYAEGIIGESDGSGGLQGCTTSAAPGCERALYRHQPGHGKVGLRERRHRRAGLCHHRSCPGRIFQRNDAHS